MAYNFSPQQRALLVKWELLGGQPETAKKIADNTLGDASYPSILSSLMGWLKQYANGFPAGTSQKEMDFHQEALQAASSFEAFLPPGSSPPPQTQTPVTASPPATTAPLGAGLGAPFKPPTRTGTAQERIAQGLGPAVTGMAPGDYPAYFPFNEGEEEDVRASRNLLRALGFNMDLGNPYTSYLQRQLPEMSRVITARDLLGEGGKKGNLEAAPSRLPGLLTSNLQSGAAPLGLGTMGELSGIQTKFSAAPETLSEGQRLMAKQYLDPDEVFALHQASLRLPSQLRRAQRGAGNTMLERYKNLGSSLGDKSFLQFLYGSQ